MERKILVTIKRSTGAKRALHRNEQTSKQGSLPKRPPFCVALLRVSVFYFTELHSYFCPCCVARWSWSNPFTRRHWTASKVCLTSLLRVKMEIADKKPDEQTCLVGFGQFPGGEFATLLAGTLHPPKRCWSWLKVSDVMAGLFFFFCIFYSKERKPAFGFTGQGCCGGVVGALPSSKPTVHRHTEHHRCF